MSKPVHWEYDLSTGEVYDPVAGEVIAEVGGHKHVRDKAGRLLAAAPELLEALENLAANECGDFLRARFPATRERAEAIRRKARGE